MEVGKEKNKMHESLRKTMEEMAMGKAPVRMKEDFLAFLENQTAVTYQDRTQPMDAEWKKDVSKRWWGTGYIGVLSNKERSMLPLRERLLSIAGEEVCMAEIDPDLQIVLDYGQIWIGQNHIKMRKGLPSHCHKNSARYWIDKKHIEKGILGIATGYALTEDNMWRQHSWCIKKT